MEPERCAECGFDGTRLTTSDAITALRSLGRRWRELFEDVPDDVLRQRPAPDVWSALEYAAHTRDLIALNGALVERVLDGERIEMPEIKPDEGAPDHGYNVLDPQAVLRELARNVDAVAARAEAALADHWARTARIGQNDIDAGWALRHIVHDATHHLRDVEIGLERLGTR